jgi:hypothetical protein
MALREVDADDTVRGDEVLDFVERVAKLEDPVRVMPGRQS